MVNLKMYKDLMKERELNKLKCKLSNRNAKRGIELQEYFMDLIIYSMN